MCLYGAAQAVDMVIVGETYSFTKRTLRWAGEWQGRIKLIILISQENIHCCFLFFFSHLHFFFSVLLTSVILSPCLPQSLLFPFYKANGDNAARIKMSDTVPWLDFKSNKKILLKSRSFQKLQIRCQRLKEYKLINLCGLHQFTPAENLTLSLCIPSF